MPSLRNNATAVVPPSPLHQQLSAPAPPPFLTRLHETTRLPANPRPPPPPPVEPALPRSRFLAQHPLAPNRSGEDASPPAAALRKDVRRLPPVAVLHAASLWLPSSPSPPDLHWALHEQQRNKESRTRRNEGRLRCERMACWLPYPSEKRFPKTSQVNLTVKYGQAVDVNLEFRF